MGAFYYGLHRPREIVLVAETQLTGALTTAAPADVECGAGLLPRHVCEIRQSASGHADAPRDAQVAAGLCSCRFVVILVAAHIAPDELLDLAGEGIAAPAQEFRGCLATAAGVLERGVEHYAFEGGYGDFE